MRRPRDEAVRLFPPTDDDHLHRLREELESSGRYLVLEKLIRPDSFSPGVTPTGELGIGLYLDVETTGTDSRTDKIIQLAAVAFEFDVEGRVHRIVGELDELEDPGVPIPREITELTGLSDKDVRGRRIDAELVDSIAARAELVIAHNAGFDRPFVERRFPAFEEMRWACSIADVDWRSEGFGSSKLEWLAFKHGFYFDSHRAGDDCLAGIRLLAASLPRSQVTALSKLLRNEAGAGMRLWAIGSPYESKDVLKQRGYRWQPRVRLWSRDIKEVDYPAELEWLTASVYGGRVPDLRPVVIDSRLRYSARLPVDPPSRSAER